MIFILKTKTFSISALGFNWNLKYDRNATKTFCLFAFCVCFAKANGKLVKGRFLNGSSMLKINIHNFRGMLAHRSHSKKVYK